MPSTTSSVRDTTMKLMSEIRMISVDFKNLFLKKKETYNQLLKTTPRLEQNE